MLNLSRWKVLLVIASVSAALGLVGRFADDARARSDEITRCRSEYRVRIDEATAISDRRESERVDIISDVITASLNKNETALKRSAAALERSKELAAQARDHVDVANRAYDRAVKLSGVNPGQFLEECAALPS